MILYGGNSPSDFPEQLRGEGSGPGLAGAGPELVHDGLSLQPCRPLVSGGEAEGYDHHRKKKSDMKLVSHV